MIRAPKAFLLGMAAVDFRCPNHACVEQIERCPVCSRTFWEHMARIAALGPVTRP